MIDSLYSRKKKLIIENGRFFLSMSKEKKSANRMGISIRYQKICKYSIDSRLICMHGTIMTLQFNYSNSVDFSSSVRYIFISVDSLDR
jgi:hypothetical protein